MSQEPWDKEAVYDRDFSPLVTRLIELAKEHDMALHVTVQYAGVPDADEGDLCTTHIEGSRPVSSFWRLAEAAMRRRGTFAITVNREDGTTVREVFLP